MVYTPKALGLSKLVVRYHVDRHVGFGASKRNDLKACYLEFVI